MSTNQELKKIVLDTLYIFLKPKQFKKIGSSFLSTKAEMKYFINLQRSQSSTAGSLKFTINIEILSSSLFKLEDTSISEKDYRHFVRRIGFYIDPPHDKWWIIQNIDEANASAEEIIEIISNKVLPEFNKLKTTNDLAEMWRQNICTGITEKQRREYLSLIDK